MDEENNIEGIDVANLDDSDANDISEDALIELGIVEGKTKADQSEKEVEPKKDLSLDEILKELSKNPKQFDQEIEDKLESVKDDEKDEKEKPEEESEDFETIVYNGEEKKLSRKELIDLAQKGFDYTQKTQELSKNRMTFEEKIKELEGKENEIFSKFEEEKTKFKNELNVKQQWDFVFDNMQKQNPDLYEEVKGFFEEVNTSYNNPLVKSLMAKV